MFTIEEDEDDGTAKWFFFPFFFFSHYILRNDLRDKRRRLPAERAVLFLQFLFYHFADDGAAVVV